MDAQTISQERIMRSFDYLIVGAGLSGCILAERIASVLGRSVLLIDRRDHIGGNAADVSDENGVLIHRYGPHAFHTNDKGVWDYLSAFTAWHLYEHRVRAQVGDALVPVPFNLTSIRTLFSSDVARSYEHALVQEIGDGGKTTISQLRNSANALLRELAEYIYANIYLGYTRKQWGLEPAALGPSVLARVPVLAGTDDRYFQDRFQGIPAEGYSTMFARMVRHPSVTVELGTHYNDVRDQVKSGRLIYTGPIDEFCGHSFGLLPYRSLRFRYRTERTTFLQPVAQVNYPNAHEYTRTTEFKHMTGQRSDWTTVAVEYPEEHVYGSNDPYYPIPSDTNQALYERYRRESALLADDAVFVGRLAEYRYYNMDQVVARALHVFNTAILGR